MKTFTEFIDALVYIDQIYFASNHHFKDALQFVGTDILVIKISIAVTTISLEFKVALYIETLYIFPTIVVSLT